MSRMTSISEESERMDFAKAAAAHFATHPKHWSYSGGGEITPGSFLALRWGLGDDCVLVLRLDPDEDPVNFQQIIRDGQPTVVRQHADLEKVHEQTMKALGTAYVGLLRQPASARVYLQPELCACRDALAAATGMDAEYVQTWHESIANGQRRQR